jgi:excinuclease ABC subunit A
MVNEIKIKGAREHNLKNISLNLPRDKFIVITGLSGSGKSTLAFDTLYAEGQRRYVESLSAYARQFLGLMNKPDVDSIEGLSPAISIEQKTTSKNPRSTVGTVTEIYDYLRLLYARIGTPYCPEHHLPIKSQTAERIAELIATNQPGSVTVFAPVVRQKKGTYDTLVKDLGKEGFARVRINGTIQKTDEEVQLERYKKHDIDIVIDRLDSKDNSRLNEAVEQALILGKGNISVESKNGEERYSSKLSCPECGYSLEELQPRMFSFNSPFGACKECSGLGIKMEFDEDLIIPDKALSIADGAIMIYRNAIDGWRGQYLAAVAKHFGFDIFTPISFLSDKHRNILLYGSQEKIKFNMSMKGGDANWSHHGEW